MGKRRQKGNYTYSELSQMIKKTIWARTLVDTLDARAACVAAKFKDTPSNIKRVRERLEKDPFVQQTIKELLEQHYPVNKRAEDFASLVSKAVSMANESDKLPEVLATINTLGKIIGAEGEGAPKKHLHIHAGNAANPVVVPPPALPKE